MNPTTLRITFSVLILWMITMSSLIGQQRTYCNPVNLDYGYCPIPDFVVNGRHRTSADPVIVLYKGDYYLFATNQQGYWWSADLQTCTMFRTAFSDLIIILMMIYALLQLL